MLHWLVAVVFRSPVKFLPLAMNDANGSSQAGVGERHRGYPAFGQFRPENSARYDTHTGSQHYCFLDRLNVIEMHRRIYRDIRAAEVPRYFARDGQVVIEHDEVGTVQIPRIHAITLL